MLSNKSASPPLLPHESRLVGPHKDQRTATGLKTRTRIGAGGRAVQHRLQTIATPPLHLPSLPLPPPCGRPLVPPKCKGSFGQRDNGKSLRKNPRPGGSNGLAPPPKRRGNKNRLI